MVTLLDGTEIPKSQVPVGAIYVNENGVKVKKIVAQEPKSLSLFGSITSGIQVAKNKIASAIQITDLCVVKIREILQQVDFKMVKDLIGEYRNFAAMGLDKLSGDEKKQKKAKLEKIDQLVKFIDGLESFSKGGNLEAPSDDVFEIAKEIATEKQIPSLVVTIQVMQIIIKTCRGISDVQTAASNNEAMTTLNAMINISVSDGVVTDEEFDRLSAQAELAGVAKDKLQEMINAAMPK